MESLEPRILLSGDPLFGAVQMDAPEEIEFLRERESTVSIAREVVVTEDDFIYDKSNRESLEYDPSENLGDIFSGLEEEDLETLSEADPFEATPLDHVFDEGQSAALKEGLSALADFGYMVEAYGGFDAPLPATDDSNQSGISGLYEILDTRLKKPVYDYFGDYLDPPDSYTLDELLNALFVSEEPDSPFASGDLGIRENSSNESNGLHFDLGYGVTCTLEVRPASPSDPTFKLSFAGLDLAAYNAELNLGLSFDLDMGRKTEETLSDFLHTTFTSAQRSTWFSSEGSFTVPTSGTLTGSGHVGDVVNYGTVSPGNSPGIQYVDTFTQGPTGTLYIEIGGLNPGPGNPILNEGYDQLQVTGPATLDGALEISLINDFTPTLGDTFDILTCGSVNGSFDTGIGLFGFGDGSLYFDLEQLDNSLRLVVKEAPGNDLSIDAAGEVGLASGTTDIPTEDSGPGNLSMDAFDDLLGVGVDDSPEARF